MDGATIFMGYVDSSGKAAFTSQAGQGHTHKDAAAEVAATVISSALKEAGGKTTLEVALKPGSYVKSGQATLDMIYAEGGTDSFSPKHSFRGTLGLKLL
jgi:hypothetical protein